jgi:glutamate carboxypeptidase
VSGSARVRALRGRLDEMVAVLRALVEAESPSADPAALRACADRIAEIGGGLLGARPERLAAGGLVHLRWRFGGPTRVLVLCHYDTV